MKLLKLAAVTAVTIAFTSTAFAGPALDKVKAKGFLQCGVSQGLAGFSAPDTAGNWTGLDVDFCRAAAAAIFGDASKVKFTPLSAKERFTALASGEIDMLSRNSTATQTRDTSLGINFTATTYYDGQGFMVRKDLGVKSALELNGASVCTNLGTTTEVNLAKYFRQHGMTYEPVVFEKADEVVAAYDSGRCDIYTTDISGLLAQKSKLADPSAHEILPETISKEPLGPFVVAGDDELFDIVRWTIFATLEAEELGLNSQNIKELAATSDSISIKNFVGLGGSTGKNMGVAPDWAYQIILQVGNYGEIWTKHIAPLGAKRGLNNLWNNGGIQYSPPVS